VSAQTPLVSVLTPVHNGAEYIEECMASVLRQTHENWSYTVVDNCSSDATPELVEQIAKKESRVRLLRFEELVDAVENHNRAITAMDPESVYCKFVQGDDWLFEECLERMVERAESAPSIGVVGAYRLLGDTVDLVGLGYERTSAPGREILRQCLLGGPYVTGSPTATMLRSKLVRSRTPFYDPNLRHGDTEAVYWALSRSDFGYVHQVLTYSRRQPGARSSVSDRVGTYAPENILFLLRYGPSVLGAVEYERQLGTELRQYVTWHARQVVKPSRARDVDFYEFHLAAADNIVRESGRDASVRTPMALVKAMLSRRRVLARPSFRGTRQAPRE
jgi:glycosyltransferase involved in cell wall biosynthesis